MKIKTKIREHISQQLDVLIPERQWERYISILDRDGIPNRKQLIGIFMTLCQHVEVLENAIEDLYFQLEMKSTEILPRVAQSGEGGGSGTPGNVFKLRSVKDITDDLDKQTTPETKAYYVNQTDWNILVKNVDASLSVNKPEYGFGKEIDPKDGKEKTCLFFKEKPIFKNLHE